MQPATTIIERAAALLGWTPTSWRPVFGGYTPAARYVASAGPERAFVKVATTRVTARMLRHEGLVYTRLSGPFMPRLLGWEDHPQAPILIIEDLSDATWPPPWTGASLDAVLEQIDRVHAAKADLPRSSDAHPGDSSGWANVAEDRDPFLSLGMASREWLDAALPRLIDAEANCPTDAATVAHFDLRSDNICLSPAGVKFIDWAAAALGNPQLDLGFLLPSLCFEGGPAPHEILPDAPQVAASVSGYFAARAGLPNIPDAPFVRRVQREQLTTALPWVARALKLGEL
jgi:thiamine kinase-like enzyme